MPQHKAQLMSWQLSTDDIGTRTDEIIKKARSVYDEIAMSEPSLSSVALKLAHFEAEYMTECNILDFLQNVSPDKDVRNASCEYSRKISDADVELQMRKDVFDKFVAVERSCLESASPELKRYVHRKVKIGQRNGLHLEESIRLKVEALCKEESRLCIDFNRALCEENTLLEFTDEELEGYPKDLLADLKTLPSGKRQISLKYPHYTPASEKVVLPETRRKLEVAFNSRCKEENRPILQRLINLRKEKASLLGFKTHADYELELRMAKNAATVSSFLSRISEKMKKQLAIERKRLLELKSEECAQRGFPNSGKLEPWDVRYYLNMVKEKDYKVDQQALKQYFPLESVKTGVLNLYQSLLGLRFEQVPADDVWHPDVTLHCVKDSETDNVMGYFYLDLHPREGKYGHAAVFDLQPGCLRPPRVTDGDVSHAVRQPAIVAIVANFTAPSQSNNFQACFLHDEVEVFFHEFGHAMHAICGETETAMFSGTSVERDFVECPSQMLENWVWCKEGLDSIRGKEAAAIPEEQLKSLLKSRTANAAHFYMRQILLATYDQIIHTTDYERDPTLPFFELSRDLFDIELSPNTCMPASFGHLAGGYDAQYYGYLWSEVFSADMFESRFRCAPDGGCLSPTVGREYREKILKLGGSIDAVDMLVNFLGRQPTEDAFFHILNLAH